MVQEYRRVFKVLPIVNFNLKKNPKLHFEKDSITSNGETILCRE